MTRTSVHALTAFIVLTLLPSAAAAGPVVWTAPSLSRIGIEDPAGTDRGITIHAAKGESESFQIVVQGPAAEVNVTAADFTSGANTIDRSNVTLYRQHYIVVCKGSSCPHPNQPCANEPLGPGLYPDALIPFKDPRTGAPPRNAKLVAAPFHLAAKKNQPVWVDVHVPRTAAAGTYTSTFTISSREGSATVAATLVVWNFELPVQPALKSSFLLEHATALLQMELLQHRLMPKDYDPATEPALIQSGLNIASLPYWTSPEPNPFWSSADPKTGTMKAAPSVEMFRREAEKHTSGLPLYCYPADEISGATALYETLKTWGRNMHQAGVRNLVTMMPDPKLYDDGSGKNRSAVDIWVVLPFQYDLSAEQCRYVQSKGDEVWSYNTLVQDNYSPKWHIDFPPINFRIHPGFISQSLHLTGLLYWRVDWGKRADGRPSDPWSDGYGMHYPADGRMVYPGEAVGIAGGVAPSMRLKWLRDGVDDFDYVDLLKKAGCGNWALEVSRTVGESWSTWTRDPARLEAARVRLGRELSGATKECR